MRPLSNAEKYHFSDFTLKQYEEILVKAKSKFVFASFKDFENCSSSFVLWRHDIDIDIDNALRMAELESKHDLKSTYFVLLRSEFYNALEPRISEKIKQIQSLGHCIALHFDARYYDIDSQDVLDRGIKTEAEILSNEINSPVEIFSFHITNSFTKGCKKSHYGGCINVYSDHILSQIPSYCSDSNGIWRHERLSDFIDSDLQCAQVLTHPIWWTKDILSPEEKIIQFMEGRSSHELMGYRQMLKETGRELISQ